MSRPAEPLRQPEQPDARAAADPVAARRAELAGRLAEVRARVAAAAQAAGREPEQITLVAVTKTYPASDAALLADLGVTDIGENRDQEAAPKAAELAAAGVAVRWHFIGQLQRNKCRSVVGYADLVQSVDSSKLAGALGAAAAHRGRIIDVLVQVSIDGDPRRGGAVVDRPEQSDRDLWRVAGEIAGNPALRLRGAMAVAPAEWVPERAFEYLAGLSERLRERYPQADILSAGMSGDLESAIAYGATLVRIGGALLGYRPVLR